MHHHSVCQCGKLLPHTRARTCLSSCNCLIPLILPHAVAENTTQETMRFFSSAALSFFVLMLHAADVGNAFPAWGRSPICIEGLKLLKGVEDRFSEKLKTYALAINSTESLRAHCERLMEVVGPTADANDVRSRVKALKRFYVEFVKDQSVAAELREEVRRLVQDIKRECGSWIRFILGSWGIKKRLEQKLADGDRMKKELEKHVSKINNMWAAVNSTGCSVEYYDRLLEQYKRKHGPSNGTGGQPAVQEPANANVSSESTESADSGGSTTGGSNGTAGVDGVTGEGSGVPSDSNNDTSRYWSRYNR
ncbi:Putative cell surface-expressed gene family [Trypanosoma congolense IL3000]|uniref:Putative cell surface-expressed gene family n=1 Tax=Trypanosoma congolense (strain IL3000) TaxID=1068625 RepID=F9WFA7_TRYCI|nr:Putative cell surface-expressed gene family [Trypanosoma congolense IL3000]